MSKNQVIIALVVLGLLGTIWGSVKDKKATSLEKQLVVMKEQAAAAPVVDEAGAQEAQEAISKAESAIKDLKSENKKLQKNIKSLKGNISSQKGEIAKLKTELKASDNTPAVEAMQAQLDKSAAEIVKLEEAVVAAKAELFETNVALTAAQETVASFEDVKATLANSVDSYSAKSQELAVEVEESRQQIGELEKALEERTKLLVAGGEELARTKLNMNILLSKIAAQNNSLSILEETREALEKELATKLQEIEELQHQLSAQVIVDAAVVVEDDAPAEESQEATPAN